ncbi:hypothetical protein IK112_03195 [Candidatus Saccharibacteria bacterium]|nr:hypothetical protein [Candidatus Saccharibacteria bacterium]
MKSPVELSKPTFPLDLFGPTEIKNPGTEYFSSAEKIGQFLKESLKQDPHFYLFSPDETTSNKLDAAFDVSARAWALPVREWDLPEAENGRIVELLSENTLFGIMAGHVLSGEPAMMTSYEAFFSIITSQLLQYLKFLSQSADVPWRDSVPAINLLSTSTCWRQDHNGFSHQSPMLISTLLSQPSNLVNCLFPVDDVAAAATYDFMYNSQNVVNLTTFNKTNEPRWIDRNHAAFQFDHGASIFGFISDDNPDYIFTAAGDIATREAIRAIKILKQDLPEKRFRFVGINALSYGAIGTTNAKLSYDLFNEFYTTDRPIIANFHGYAGALRNILSNYTNQYRLSIHGFEECGSTTTPFEMLRLNHASRYDLCIDVAYKEHREDLVARYSSIIQENTRHALEFGEDQISML